ncbi:MAG: hypothetical protein KAS32_18730 [Candidatus Peribacteraceae bacterium]|nr:hypothetical protein [Candidatus Peribacteraceae bacterium]
MIDIKHNAGRLGFITCKNEKENQVVYGFFRRAHSGIKVNIVNIRDNRIMLFYDDLRYHLLHFYIVGGYLKEAILKSVKHFHNLELPIKKNIHKNNKYLEVLQTIASNPVLFIGAFNSSPPTYLCKLKSDANNVCLKINTSKVHATVSWKDNVKCASTFFADGYSRAHEIP